MKTELHKLKVEEDTLQIEFKNSQIELNALSKNLQDTQLEISQVKAMVSQIEETKRQMVEALDLCKTALSKNDMNVSDYILNIEPDFKEAVQLVNKNKFKTSFEENEHNDAPSLLTTINLQSTIGGKLLQTPKNIPQNTDPFALADSEQSKLNKDFVSKDVSIMVRNQEF